jgi:hypothetical protein
MEQRMRVVRQAAAGVALLVDDDGRPGHQREDVLRGHEVGVVFEEELDRGVGGVRARGVLLVLDALDVGRAVAVSMAAPSSTMLSTNWCTMTSLGGRPSRRTRPASASWA